ncbi:MAG: GNAT family N-acetyltransferase [Anaerolineales bacterium]
MTGRRDLFTKRLHLRPFTLKDAPDVARYCGDWDIARMTANIPHPYDESMAREWISGHQQAFDEGESVTFAITLRESGELVGAIGIHVDKTNRAAEFGYWIGKPFWNQGYATEASKAVIAFGFKKLGLNRIYARHMTKNPASGRVMQKAGMRFEGVLRESLYRFESFNDAAIYSILASEYRSTGSA